MNRSIQDIPANLVINIQKTAAPLRQQVLESLRQEIIKGRLAPGQRLTERELTQMLDVSRTVVREVLRQLESEGLVALIPNKGPVVRELSPAEAKDLYQIREVLEGLAARLFAENATPGQLVAIEHAFARVVAAYEDGDTETILDAKNAFFDALHAGTASETLGTMLASLHARIWRWRALGLSHPDRSPERSRQSVENLTAVMEALRRRDGDEAERLARWDAQLAAMEVMRLVANGDAG